MKKYLKSIILLISIVTLFSGAMQVIVPAFVLKFVGADINPATQQLFATIGMFMFLFGGMMIHVLYSAQDNKAAVLWSALQKFGASVAVFVGIYNHSFAPVAGLVAGFDFISFILFMIYYRMVSRLN